MPKLTLVEYRALSTRDRTPKRNRQPEFDLQTAIAGYLNRQYPKIKFLSDVRGNIDLTPQQAKRSKLIQHNDFNCPDVIIFAPRGNFAGLFIELKAASPFLLTGELSKQAHIQAQYESMLDLREAGFMTTFGWHFATTRALIDDYLSHAENPFLKV